LFQAKPMPELRSPDWQLHLGQPGRAGESSPLYILE
jgi:hypothetical protein